MTDILTVSLLITSALLVIIIILQPKGEWLSLTGTSVGSSARFEKRGAELMLHRITIALSVVYVALALALYLLG